jgi:GT2 family glycosyltransferase
MAEPFLSIIVPTYNRPDSLASCVQSVVQLDYPCDRFEALIVDDGSRVPPTESVREVKDAVNVRLLTQPHGGPARARNLAAWQAKGDYLVFIDDDCRVPPDFLARVSAELQATPDTGIGGKTVNVLDNVYSAASQVHVDYLYNYYNRAGDTAQFFSSNNLALPADAFRRIGGFDASFITGEDRELCDRWLHAGHKLRYCPEVQVYHAHALTFASFCSQHFNYGRGAFRYRQRRAARTQSRIGVEALAFYVNLVTWRAPGSSRRRGPAVPALLGISQLANTAGFLWELGAGSTPRANPSDSSTHR